MRDRTKTILICTAGIYLFFAFAVFKIQPSGDDWGLIDHPDWFLGVGPVYRPFEYFFSWLTLKFPGTFPYINHLIVLICHAFNAYMLYRLILKFKIARPVALYSSVFFLFAPAVMGTVTSIDGTNQVISAFYSLLGFFAYFNYTGFKKYFLWLLLTMIAAMHKEIGITWFIGTPLLAYIINHKDEKEMLAPQNLKASILPYVLGVCFVVVYLVVRVNTSISGMIGAADPKIFPNYRIEFGKNILINFSMLLGSSATAIDTVAYFGYPRKIFLVLLTIILSLPFLLLIAMRVYNRLFISKQWRLILMLLLFIITVTSPHLIMGRCGELHAYSMVLPFTIFLSVIFDGIKASPVLYTVMVLFGISIIIADFHKWHGAHRNGLNGLKIINAINSKTKVIPERIKVISVGHNDYHVSYSSFYQDEKLTYNNSLVWLHFHDKIRKIDKVMLSAYDPLFHNKVDSVINESFKDNYQHVWIVDATNVAIVDLEKRK
jgi:hypothetical protein